MARIVLSDGLLDLHLGFDNVSPIVGGATVDTALSVLVRNTLGGVTTTLFNNSFTSAVRVIFRYNVPAGGISTLGLLLLTLDGTVDPGGTTLL